MCDQHNCPNEGRGEDGLILGRCGEDPGELIEKIKRLEAYVGTNDLRSDYQSADHMRETIKKLQADQKDLLETAENGYLKCELHEEREKTGRLEAIFGYMLHSYLFASPSPTKIPAGLRHEFYRQLEKSKTAGEWEDSEPVAPAEYQPDHATPPGDTITEMMEERGMEIESLADRLGCLRTHFFQVLQGNLPITDLIAYELSQVFGTPVSFWLNLERNYRRNLARLKDSEPATPEEKTLDKPTETG